MKKIEQTLLFLTLLFLPTQLGRHFWPGFSFIYSLKIDYLSPTIYFWDLLVLGLVSIRTCSFHSQNLAFLTNVKNVKIINIKALNLLLVFLLSQLISLLPTVSSASIGVGLVRFEQYAVAGLFGVYLASLDFGKVRKIFFWALTLSVLLESMLAIAQFLKAGTLGFWILGERTFSISTPAIAKFDFYSHQFLRPYGTFPHPNVLAAFLVLLIIILNVFRDPIKYTVTLKLVTAAAAIAAMLTVSRATIVAGIFSAFFLFKKRWFIWILLVLVLVSPFLYPRFSSILSFDSLTVLRREQLSELALRMWSSSLFFGIGLNNFILASAENLVIGPSRFLQPVHNIFLLTLAETGVLGVIGVIGLIGWPIYKLIKFRAYVFEFRILLLCWGIIIFLGMFDHYFLTLPQGYRLLFLIWGLSMSMLK